MKPLQPLPWTNPLDAARKLTDTHWVLLYSGTKTSYSGRYSYLAHGLQETVSAEHFTEFAKVLRADRPWYENMWFGYLGYGLKHDNESLPQDSPASITLPNLYMMRFAHILRFDHEQQLVECFSDGPLPAAGPAASHTDIPAVKQLHSNMTGAEYTKHVETILEHIRAGSLYQANLTRKFYGEFSQPPAPFALFEALCAASPAPYSAFMRMGHTAIISSSPELFLHTDHAGNVRTRPIKGTAPRHADRQADQQAYQTLLNSEKDKAENLMIVDLMRNDLARSCEAGSVHISEPFAVTSHATVHHMSTTIHGKKRTDCSALDVVRQCFPPGSMTGAPKIRAMELCTQLEQQARGVYAGAIGFFDGAGGCELSVVIRTLLVQGAKFEFQVGGAIVADSTPEAEKQETYIKAAGLLKALGLPDGALDNV